MSLILLGILNSQAAGAAAAGGYDLLETQELGTAAASVTFTGLDSYSGYTHLQLRYMGRTDRAATGGDDLAIRFNADTGSNYAYHLLNSDGNTASDLSQTSANRISYLRLTSGLDTTDVFGAGVIDIADFNSSSKNTTIRAISGAVPGSAPRIRFSSGVWIDTSSVTSITCLGDNGNLVAGTRLSLYGRA